jgi:L-rhamnose-H+ transport protein
MRYLGVAMGQSIALGTCSAFGTLIPALIAGENLFTGKGLILLIAVSIDIAGIAVIGYAGALKSQNMTEEEKKKAVKDFALKKGLLIALLAGVMSACFNLGLESGVKKATETLQVEDLYAGLPATLLVTLGGFLTNAIYCIFQNIKNKTGKQYFTVSGSVLTNNLLFCALAGLLWYLQFFGKSVGESFFDKDGVMFAFSWSILMSLNVLFSNVWGILLKEWKGAGKKSVAALVIGLFILVLSIIFTGVSQQKDKDTATQPEQIQITQ